MTLNKNTINGTITGAFLAAKGSGKSVALAMILNNAKSGILIDMLGVYNPRNRKKTAIVPNSAYYNDVDSFIKNYKDVPEKKHIINFGEYVSHEEIINAADKLSSFIYNNIPDIMVLCDEVADIMPQSKRGSNEFHRLVKNGRNRGIYPVIMATQRPQSTDKSVFDLCDTFFVSLQRAPKTIDYILDILDRRGDKETGTKIRQLKARQFLKYDGENLENINIQNYKYAFKQ